MNIHSDGLNKSSYIHVIFTSVLLALLFMQIPNRTLAAGYPDNSSSLLNNASAFQKQIDWDGWKLVDRLMVHYLIMGKELFKSRPELISRRVERMRLIIEDINLNSNPWWDLKSGWKNIAGQEVWDRGLWIALRDIDDSLRFMNILGKNKEHRFDPLETYRAQYDRLSRALVDLLYTRYHGPRALYIYMCPLYDRVWLQSERSPDNPYLGKFWPDGGTALTATPIGVIR